MATPVVLVYSRLCKRACEDSAATGRLRHSSRRRCCLPGATTCSTAVPYVRARYLRIKCVSGTTLLPWMMIGSCRAAQWCVPQGQLHSWSKLRPLEELRHSSAPALPQGSLLPNLSLVPFPWAPLRSRRQCCASSRSAGLRNAAKPPAWPQMGWLRPDSWWEGSPRGSPPR